MYRKTIKLIAVQSDFPESNFNRHLVTVPRKQFIKQVLL